MTSLSKCLQIASIKPDKIPLGANVNVSSGRDLTEIQTILLAVTIEDGCDDTITTVFLAFFLQFLKETYGIYLEFVCK